MLFFITPKIIPNVHNKKIILQLLFLIANFSVFYPTLCIFFILLICMIIFLLYIPLCFTLLYFSIKRILQSINTYTLAVHKLCSKYVIFVILAMLFLKCMTNIEINFGNAFYFVYYGISRWHSEIRLKIQRNQAQISDAKIATIKKPSVEQSNLRKSRGIEQTKKWMQKNTND